MEEIGSDGVGITEIERDEVAKKLSVEIGNKSIRTPCYMTKIQKDYELNVLCDFKYPLEHLQGIFYDIFNVDKVIKQKESNSAQIDLFKNKVEIDYMNLKKRIPIFIDPCTEYFYHNVEQKRNDFLSIPSLPHPLREFLKYGSSETHYKYWKDIFHGFMRKYLSQIVKWFIERQLMYFADVIIPPTPYITGNSDELVNHAIEMNTYTTSVVDNLGKKCSLYFPIHSRVFRKEPEQLEGILDFLYDSIREFENISLIFVKIKYYNFKEDTISRENLKNFKSKLYEISEYTRKALFLIDARTLGYACTISGFDGFIEPLSGNVKDFGRGSGVNLGSYYNPNPMQFYSYEDIRKNYNASGKTFPCSGEYCRSYNGLDFDRILDWNTFRRKHLLEARNIEMRELHRMISERESRAASDKIMNSGNKAYLEILVNGF